ncbi:MAG: pseudouridine-5'-phosphate glycosidase [Pseudomonadales bacterium]
MRTNPNTSALDVAPGVGAAIAENRPVVALESTIISHGMPYPQNVDTALRIQKTIRAEGAVPAVTAILNGRLRAGLSDEEIDYLGREGQRISKASRRDLAFLVARQQDGATTVAATMIIAAMASIRVFATGGIGGVHRGAATTMDVSADLQELAKTNVAVVCSGVKSILDISKTLEYLETQGVAVVGYETDTLPAFYARSSGLPVDYRIDEPLEAAIALKAQTDNMIDGGLLITVPVPESHALESADIDGVISKALVEMENRGITGKATTPFLLSRIAEQTKGRSLDANIELAVNNARVAAKIAIEYSSLMNKTA